MTEKIHEIIVQIGDKDFHENGLDGCLELTRCKDCAWHKEKRCTVWRERAVIIECYTDDEGYCYLAKEKDDA